MKFIHSSIPDLAALAKEKRREYMHAEPFPNISFRNFFDEEMLSRVLAEFPDLEQAAGTRKFDNHNEKKLAAAGEQLFGDATKALVHFLNSEPMLLFLQELTGIRETLLPDPYLIGGGYHEIKPGGLLKIHADFNRHKYTGLDRRINLLVYLNKDWQESYGGHFELWDRDMTAPVKKILPLFNTVALFSTTDFSYHGHPNPLTCPPDRSRKSIALYYYSNGRPASEINAGLEEHSTIFKDRKGIAGDTRQLTFKNLIRDLVPPVFLKAIRKR